MNTKILNNLEWMAENLTGHDGTEIYGNWYYTWEQAIKAAEEVGDGWRLPTEEEFNNLCKLVSTWDNEKKGRWFGKNEELFLPALGYRSVYNGEMKNVGEYGGYWCVSKGIINYITYSIISSCNCEANYIYPYAYAFSVRLVRDIEK